MAASEIGAGRGKKKQLEVAIRLGWLVHDEGATDYYTCDICRAKGWDQERACFRYNDRDLASVVHIRGDAITPTRDRAPTTRADVWRKVEQLHTIAPHRHVLFWLIDILGVCPEGLITPDIRQLVEEEAMCETYHTTPLGGGLDDQPALMYDAFKVIRQTHQQVQNEKRQKAAAKNG